MTTGRGLRLGEAILGGVVLALGLFIGGETLRTGGGPFQAVVGPTLFPFLISTGLIVIGVMVLREAFFGHIAHERGFELDWLAVVLVSAGLIIQIFLLETMGWIIASTLLFMGVARAFSSRRIFVDALIGLAISSLAFVIFNYGLDLSLPTGTLIEEWLPGGGDS